MIISIKKEALKLLAECSFSSKVIESMGSVEWLRKAAKQVQGFRYIPSEPKVIKIRRPRPQVID